MPEICRFYGIIISMNYDDHNPPHFHAAYAEYRATFIVETSELDQGELPPKGIKLVQEWAWAHQKELMEEWELAREGRPLFKIDPIA